MCVDPVTIFTVASLASAGLSAYSSVQQGNAAYESSMYNAEVQRRNAQSTENDQAEVKDAAAIERRRAGERVRAERGDLTAKYSAMGIDPGFGSPADVVGDVKRAYDIDRSILGRNELTELGNLDKQRADFLDAATLSEAEGKSARKAGQIGAAGALLQGAASVSSKWIQPPSSATSATPPLKKPQPTTRSPSVLKLGG